MYKVNIIKYGVDDYLVGLFLRVYDFGVFYKRV